MQIADVDGALNGGEALIVGGSVSESGTNSPAGHPPRESAAVVVHVAGAAAAHFATPDDQRLIEQAAFFEIGDQPGERLVAGLGEIWDEPADLSRCVRVPVAAAAFQIRNTHAGHKDKTHTTLHQAPRQEKLRTRAARRLWVEAVQVSNRGAGGLLRNVERLGRSSLHALRGEERFGARVKLGNMSVSLAEAGIQSVQLREPSRLLGRRHRTVEVCDGSFQIVDNLRLERRWQTASSDGSRAAMYFTVGHRPFVTFGATGQQNVPGQAGIAATQTVQHPGTETRSEFARAGENVNASFVVCGESTVARTDQTQFISHVLQTGEDVSNLQPGLTALPEAERMQCGITHAARLIEGVRLRRSAFAVVKDDALHLAGMMQRQRLRGDDIVIRP